MVQMDLLNSSNGFQLLLGFSEKFALFLHCAQLRAIHSPTILGMSKLNISRFMKMIFILKRGRDFFLNL